MQNVLPMIEVTTNHWRVPGEDTAIDGWIEGHPHIVPCCHLFMPQHERTLGRDVNLFPPEQQQRQKMSSLMFIMFSIRTAGEHDETSKTPRRTQRAQF